MIHLAIFAIGAFCGMFVFGLISGVGKVNHETEAYQNGFLDGMKAGKETDDNKR